MTTKRSSRRRLRRWTRRPSTARSSRSSRILRAGNGLLGRHPRARSRLHVWASSVFTVIPRPCSRCNTTASCLTSCNDRITIAVDPMLATGNSSCRGGVAAETSRGLGRFKLPLPPRGSRGHRSDEGGSSGRTDCHGGSRQTPERPRLHRAGSGGCRRPHVRHQVNANDRHPSGGAGRIFLLLDQKLNHVTILHDILFAFSAELAGFTSLR
jgi:hypothetical protein